MKKYVLRELPELRKIADMIKSVAGTMPEQDEVNEKGEIISPSKYNFNAWSSINMFGWKLDAGLRVTLDPVELGWALDLATEE